MIDHSSANASAFFLFAALFAGLVNGEAWISAGRLDAGLVSGDWLPGPQAIVCSLS